VRIVIKRINSPNGVSNIETRYHWWSEVVRYPNIVQYIGYNVQMRTHFWHEFHIPK
jgi:hypothetical protein